MPITAWNCPVCEQRNLELDHFEGPCGDTIHPDYPAAILRHERNHYRYGKRAIGVTDVIGCPRKAAISSDVGYSVDPTTLNSMSTGSAWDAWVTAGHPKETLSGVFGGVHVIGEPDRVRGDEIGDWKHSSDFAEKWITQAKPDHRCQVSMYGEMLVQSKKGMPKRGRLMYHFSGRFGKTFTFPLMSMDEILAYKPVEGPTTIHAHLTMLDEWRARATTWESMPLTGESQSYGTKSACDYCAVRDICQKQAHGAAF